MITFPVIWISAIIYASLITILSIGFTLTYLTAKIPNFAHGTYAGVGVYISFTIVKVFNLSPYIGFPISFLFGGIVSIIIFILVINVLTRMGGGPIILTISTLAIQIFLTSLLYIYSYWLRIFLGSYSQVFLLKENDFKFMGYNGIFPIALLICIVTVIILHYMLNSTKVGVSMRATAEDPELAMVLGININRVQIFSWFLTGGLACLAGAMLPMWFMSTPATGAGIITSIMAGSLLGGLDSIYGSVVGGFCVGMSEILVTYYLADIVGVWIGEWRPLVPMLFLILILVLEPRGLHGVYERARGSAIVQNYIKSRKKEKEEMLNA